MTIFGENFNAKDRQESNDYWERQRKMAEGPQFSGWSPSAETSPWQPYCCFDVEKYKWCMAIGMWLGFVIVLTLVLYLGPKLF